MKWSDDGQNEVGLDSCQAVTCRGSTILEVLVALTLLFITVTVAFRLQSMLESKLGTKTLEFAVQASDSIMVEVLSVDVRDTVYRDTLGHYGLESQVRVTASNSARKIRIDILDGKKNNIIHSVYYEDPLPKENE